ncbi:MAG: RNA-binding protein [Nitrospira sp.]|nr:RNA-binding protein [Nitrospira sp.]
MAFFSGALSVLHVDIGDGAWRAPWRHRYLLGISALRDREVLYALFVLYGWVRSVGIATSWDGRPLRIDEVQMERAADADWAIRLLHRSEMDGELILVFRLREDLLPLPPADLGQ